MHGSLVTSSLVRETSESESQNYGYKFGQEEETYNIVAAHGYLKCRMNAPARFFDKILPFAGDEIRPEYQPRSTI
ncbi:MAG: hypothetical protein RLZZ143_3418 [Cyanobacteriota bacterium]|jgi:hypothetical protein